LQENKHESGCLWQNAVDAAPGPHAKDAIPPQPASVPHLTVADLRADPENGASVTESHDLHFTVGDISLLVNVQGGAGFAWALTSRDGKTDEHGSKNTDEDGAYRALPPAFDEWTQTRGPLTGKLWPKGKASDALSATEEEKK
jgi:hypothetical protein